MYAGLDLLTLLLTRTAVGGYLGSVVIVGASVSQGSCDEIEGDGYAKDTTTAAPGLRR
jgi:hypothetical protein